MTTGIYQLNFHGHAFYVGQSLDIEMRWKQHADKLKKGTAAQKMQQAYNNYGMPDGVILLECHKDYLDIMENYYIHECKKYVGCLNTSAPKLDPSINYEWLLENIHLLKHSSIEILQQAVDISKQHSTLQEHHDDLKHNFNKQYMIHKATVELRDGKDENEELVKAYHSRLHAAQERLNKLNNRGFFGRLFNYD